MSYDVVVVGAGTAGSIAAIAAARTGARTLLVERTGTISGVLQLGMSFLGVSDGSGERALGGVGGELLDRLKALGAATKISSDPLFGSLAGHDPHFTKMTLIDMCLEANVEFLLHSALAAVETRNGEVISITVANKAGLQVIKAKQFVDCTGDADLVAFGGGDYSFGAHGTGLSQPASAIFRVGNVDLSEVFDYLDKYPEELDKPEGYTGTAHTLEHLKRTPGASLVGFRNAIQRAQAAGDYNIPHEILALVTLPNNNEVTVNVSRIQGIDGTDPFSLTKAEIETQRQMGEIVRFLRKYIPGCQNCRLTSSPYQVGIRETRHIQGAYTLTQEDVVSGQSFPDQVARGAYPLDVHDVGTKAETVAASQDDGKGVALTPIKHSYGIPIRCLLPARLTNVSVAGRPISATHEAAGSTRGQSVCMTTGHAAGTNAALAALGNTNAHEVNLSALQSTLRNQNAIVDR